MKKIRFSIYIFIILSICLLLSGNVKASAFEDISRYYGYSQLNAEEKAIYYKIVQALDAFCVSDAYNQDLNAETGKIAVSELSGSFDSITHAFYVLLKDHPQYYWLGSGGQGSGVNSVFTLYLKVDPAYYSASLRASADEAIQSISAEWITELNGLRDNDDTDDTDIYLIGLRLHDLIIDQIDYLYKDGQPSKDKSAHSIVGVFDGSGAVCEGYARAYQYILNRMDIDNMYITGTSRNQGHGWNAIKLDGKYYCVDTTWDDANSDGYLSEYENRHYDFFCTPVSLFQTDHKADTDLYSLPAFSDDDNYVFYKYFKSFTAQAVTSENVDNFISEGTGNSYGDYVYFVVPDTESLRQLARSLGINGYFSYHPSDFGKVLVYENVSVTNPAASISLDVEKQPLELALDTKATVTATLVGQNSGNPCDDRIIWKISDNKLASISIKDNTCTITGLRNGTVTLTATTRKGTGSDGKNLTASVEVKVGTGEYTPLFTIWANGDKNHKTVTIRPTIRATSYKDSKGKSKKGKLVWLVKEENEEPDLDTEAHKVYTKSDKNLASISNSGKVTAKKAGTVYVYCIDTGSMDYECYDIAILQAPTKLLVGNEAASQEKENILKNPVIKAGATCTAYIIPVAKDSDCSSENSYTISFAKSTDSKYLSFTAPEKDSKGNYFFTVTGISHDTAKNKPASAKLVILNKESGKKLSLTIKVINPVTGFAPSLTGSSLTKKGNTVKIKLNPQTFSGSAGTTDTFKFYVAQDDISIENNKIMTQGKTKLKVKYDKTKQEIILTAGEDAANPAIVAVAASDSTTKTTVLYYLCNLSETGNVSIMSNSDFSDQSTEAPAKRIKSARKTSKKKA